MPSNVFYPSSKPWHQTGFTLLELMVAMAIFAMMAVAGWQVFDNLSRSGERAGEQTAVLESWQYGYSQVARDMGQVVAYHSPQSVSAEADNGSGGMRRNGFTLTDNTLSFIRYADPDPRYPNANLLERVNYEFRDNQLIRQRYRSLDAYSNDVPIESLVVGDVSAGQWQVLLPEPSAIFPVDDASTENQNSLSLPSQNGENSSGQAGSSMALPELPKGVSVSFVAKMGNEDIPITWQFALPSVPPNVKTPPKPEEEPSPNPSPNPDPSPDPSPNPDPPDGEE